MAEREPMESLARRAAAGDRQAFEDLVGIYEPRVAALARDLLGKRALQYVDVADIVQETFAKAFQHIDRLVWKGDPAFFGWLSSIAQNVVLSEVQKVRRAPLQLQPDIPDPRASPSKDAADVNDDGAVDISDPVSLLNHLFIGGERPAVPFGTCGTDPTTADLLDCKTFEKCP